MSDLTYSRANPFLAVLEARRPLSAPQSNKSVWHLSVGISGSGMSFECGDSLGVYVKNKSEEVEVLLKALKLSPEEPVQLPKHEDSVNLREALTQHLTIHSPTGLFLKKLRAHATQPEDKERLDALLDSDPEALKAYLLHHEYTDILNTYPGISLSAQVVVDSLRKLMPRLYSIASSPAVNADSIDLTVAALRYRVGEAERFGVASNYLIDRCKLGERSLPVFVASSHFRLPEDSHRDIIMVGPGTGVAPFRAFLQHRSQYGHRGRNWLFFGDQHRDKDYLYASDWEAFKEAGCLTRLDLAFSRDQSHKIYVQDRMREAAKDLWEWIDGGAVFYVCGDAKRMAPDVQNALLDVLMQEGRMDADQAKDYLKKMKKEGRYQRDVY